MDENEYRAALKARFPKIVCSGKYKATGKSLEYTCNHCGAAWRAVSTTTLNKGCPTCKNWTAKGLKIDIDRYRQLLAETHPNLIVELPKVVSKKFAFTCTTCTSTWIGYPREVLAKKYPCVTCRNNAPSYQSALRITKEEWDRRIAAKHGGRVRLMGQLRGSNVKHRFRCYTCLNTWKASLYEVATNSGCPHCAVHRKKSGCFKIKELLVAGATVRLQGYEPQALAWLLENKQLKLSDIQLETSGCVPVIPYKTGRRKRNYYPDMFIKRLNTIVEVKSSYTLGLLSGKHWRRNQLKAKACLALNYKFLLLLMDRNGKRWWLPENWYNLSRKKVATLMAFNNADEKPETFTAVVHPKVKGEPFPDIWHLV